MSLLLPDVSQGVVEVPLSDLSRLGKDLIEHLIVSKAEPFHWISLAATYLQQGNLDDAKTTLEAFRDSSPSTDTDGNEALTILADLQRHSLMKHDAIGRRSALEAIHSILDTDHPLSDLNSGLLWILKGEMDKAEEAFKAAASKQRGPEQTLLPMLALAVHSFKLNDYTRAMAYLTRVMKRLGSRRCPNEVRVAIGFCFFKMGRLDYAIKIFERCRASFGAAYGLISAYLQRYLHKSTAHRRMTNFRKLVGIIEDLVLKFEDLHSSPFAAVLCLCLTKIALIKGDYEAAAKLSQGAIDSATSDSILSRGLLYLGRSKHALGDLAESMSHYNKALLIKPDLVAARYGLSQINIASGNFRNAATSLDHILSLYLQEITTESFILPGTAQYIPLEVGNSTRVTQEHVGEALRILSVLSTKLPSAGKESKWLEALNYYPNQIHTDPSTYAAVGEMLSGREQMEAFKTALELYSDLDEKASKHNSFADMFDVPPLECPKAPLRLHNNAAVSFYEIYKQCDSDWKECLVAAMEHSKKALAMYGENKVGLSKVTLQFNRARIAEENRTYTYAASIYKEIINSVPLYLEAHVQLINICRKMNHLDLAIAQATESAKTFPKSPIIACMLGALYLEKGDFQQSKDYLYSVTKGDYPNYPLALVLLGTFYFRSVPKDYLHPVSRQKAKERLSKALDYFLAALSVDRNCLHAAHGASAAIGEFGRCADIPKLYESIVDLSSKRHWTAAKWSLVNPFKLPAAEINLGNLWFVRNQFSHAINLYRYAMELYRKEGRADPSIYALIAKSQYQSRTKIKDAIESLCRMERVCPWDRSVKLNLALVLQGYGIHFLMTYIIPEALPDSTPLDEISQAIEAIERAVVLYTGLKQIPEENLCVQYSTIDEQIQLCHEYKTKGEQKLEAVQSILRRQAIQDEVNRKEWQAHLEKEAHEQRQREEENRRLDAERAARDRELDRQRKRRIEMTLQEEETKPRKRKSKKKERQGPLNDHPREADRRDAIQDKEGDAEMRDLELEDDLSEVEPNVALHKKTALLSDDDSA